MKKEERLVAVNESAKHATIDDFVSLMQRAEKHMNEKSQQDKKFFYKMSATKLEQESCDCIKSVCDGTIFKPEYIELVSGHKFPDIEAKPRFGVEVKSTEKDSWVSTGSSIMESTRIDSVEVIYMLFGKLGSKPPEFKCRPYDEVLKEIHVTHSPRYTIDMNLNSGETIFDKMSITYEDFRRKDNKIDIVRNYYRDEAKRKKRSEMPWWLGNDTPVNMRIMREGMDCKVKNKLIAEMLILFPETLCGEYDEAVVWLCTRRNTINPSFRDIFSAGGRCVGVDDETFPNSFPHSAGVVLEYSKLVKQILTNNIDEMLLMDLIGVWKMNVAKNNLYQIWLDKILDIFNKSIDLKDFDIVSIINKTPKLIRYTGGVKPVK